MKRLKFLNFKIIFSATIVLFFLVFSFSRLDAQTAAKPDFMISWQARSYIPAWYQGKIFPTKDSFIEVAFELIEKNQIADLSKTKVRWYINDHLVKNEDSGLGIKSISFNTRDYPEQETGIGIVVFDYKNFGEMSKYFRIPVSSPGVVIDAKFPERKISTGQNLFYAYPFFFNTPTIDDISFNWTANEQNFENNGGKGWILNMDIDQNISSGFLMRIRTGAQNIQKELEFANGNIQLQVR